MFQCNYGKGTLSISVPNIMFSFSYSFRVDGETVHVYQQKLLSTMHEAFGVLDPGQWVDLLGTWRLACFICLPTPMALASRWSPIFQVVVRQPVCPSIWPAGQSLRQGLSTNPGVTMWCIYGCS